MKIVAILESRITVGGGFNQAINAIIQMQALCNGKYEFDVLTTYRENVALLKKLGIQSHFFSYSFVDILLAAISLNLWWQSIQKRMEFIGRFEKKLIRSGCDLVYFVSPTEKSAALQKLNVITTVWDACHRDMPEFPEVRSFNKLHERERFFQNHLFAPIVTLTDSEELSASLSRRYGIDKNRLLAMPFVPAKFEAGQDLQSTADVQKKYSLDQNYFFYPAQFWPHKNHIRIIEALILLRAHGIRPQVVFSGGNQGNRIHVEAFVKHHQLSDQIRFLNFVPATDMPGLYKGCRAVVMPTYFGPTNLPPLEAWLFEKPLIYSKQFAKQVGDAAILVDPDNANELASALIACRDPVICAELIEKGQKHLATVERDRQEAEMRLCAILDRFEKRRQCWSI